MKKISTIFYIFLSFFLLSEETKEENKSMVMMEHEHHAMEHDHHAMNHESNPIGVMGNLHHKGFMFSLKHEYMKMEDNIFDGDHISNQDILDMPNPLGNMPPKLSVIPQEMVMEMTMLEGMYVLPNKITLMLMGTFISKDMKLQTFSPMMNRSLLGNFNTSSSDLSEITFGAMFKIKEEHNSKWHGEFSFQKSIGEKRSKDLVLTPMGESMVMILPYGMQSGDGSSRLILGLTNKRKLNEKLTWGNQFRRNTVVNDQEWSYGNKTEFNSWLQHQLKDSLAISYRFKFSNQNKLNGNSLDITAPLQTANPENYGGKVLHLGLGINYRTAFLSKNELIGLEVLFPLVQDKNKLQMKSSYQITLGYQKSF